MTVWRTRGARIAVPKQGSRRRQGFLKRAGAAAGYALFCVLSPHLWAGPGCPEPNPPVDLLPPSLVSSVVSVRDVSPASTYSIGDPSDDEQALLELINRARANAGAEALRLLLTTDPDVLQAYSDSAVNLLLMTNQFATLVQTLPPLSLNACLLRSARLHSQDMLANAFQGHYSSSNAPPPDTYGDGPYDRIQKQGYSPACYGENVYAYGRTVFYSHAGFEVDWAGGDTNAIGGMQSPPGHRNNIHSSAYHEIGIGIVAGVNGSVGPLSVTEDFASSPSATPFITGVAYYDLNGNGFYDSGEGLGGITVTVTGLAIGAVTAVSGGYSVPVPGNGTYTVIFSGPNFQASTNLVSVTNASNVKLDFCPAYVAPALVGPGVAFTGGANTYSVIGLGGATNHDIRTLQLGTNSWIEGAETGTNFVILQTSPGYSPFASNIVHTGSHSFHLTHPLFEEQSLALTRLLYVQATNTTLQFYGRLGWATTAQTAHVQLSSDDGANWTNIFSQAGTGSSGETTFALRSIALGAYTGLCVRLRFVYDVSTSAYMGTTDGYGWYVDDITAPGTREVLSISNLSLGAATSFTWIPPAAGDYLMEVRGTFDRRQFAYSSPLVVSASNLRFVISGIDQLASDRYQVRVLVTSGTAAGLSLEVADTLTNGFTPVSTTLSGPTAGEYALLDISSTNVAHRFYRVLGN